MFYCISLERRVCVCVRVQDASDARPVSSRTSVTASKCRYTHSYSLRFLQAADDVLLNSCLVKVQLVDDVFLHKASLAYSAECREFRVFTSTE